MKFSKELLFKPDTDWNTIIWAKDIFIWFKFISSRLEEQQRIQVTEHHPKCGAM